MIHSFQSLLVSLNPTSGNRSWWVAYAFGMAIIGAWLVAVLPWVDLFTGSMVGVGRYGGVLNTTMIAYGQKITGRVADYYFLAVFLGIAVMKIGHLLMQVSCSFARGYKYWFTPGMGILYCGWTR